MSYLPAFRGYSIEQKCKSLPPVTFKLGKCRQQTNVVSQGYGRRRRGETLVRKSWCWWASLCRMVREGLSDSSVTLEQQHDWSEETSQAEGIGRNWSTLVSAKGRDIAKSTYDGHIHLLFGSEEKGKGKPVLYAWRGNNPMLPLGALPLGGQYWVLLSVAFLGWRQSLQKYLHWPDFCEQSWIERCGLEFFWHWRWFWKETIKF